MPASFLLAVDTSGEPTSVALLRPAQPPLLRSSRSGERSGDVLHRLIASALDEAGARPSDVDRIVAVRGPGSFTGLRVGLAAAAGLVLAWRRPGIGVETTAAVALASGAVGRLTVVLDGGQGRVFVGLHDVVREARAAAVVKVVEPPVDADVSDVADAAAQRGGLLLVRGDSPGLDRLRSLGAQSFAGPLAEAAGVLAQHPEHAGPLEPLYARGARIRPAASVR